MLPSVLQPGLMLAEVAQGSQHNPFGEAPCVPPHTSQLSFSRTPKVVWGAAGLSNPTCHLN